MTKNETCKALGISLATCNRWQRDGKLKWSKLGNGHIDFDDDDVKRKAESIRAELAKKITAIGA